MGIKAKDLAKELQLSEAAVSMALHNKPGVSTATRKKVLELAKRKGYDFSRINAAKNPEENKGTIYYIIYRKSGALVPNTSTETITDTPFFAPLSEGIRLECSKHPYDLTVCYIYEKDDPTALLRSIESDNTKGILLLGTELTQQSLSPFQNYSLPLVVIDNFFDELPFNYVSINNIQGAFLATEHLIRTTHKKPGYLHSSYPSNNFEGRKTGFYKALRENGMSTPHPIIHSVTPTMEGAYEDMIFIIDSKEPLASCYFADNDLIAIGAMRAILEAGYKIPEDIAIIGFDDMPLCKFMNPPVSAVHVPKQYMGSLAVKRLIELMESKEHSPVNIELSTTLMLRKSC